MSKKKMCQFYNHKVVTKRCDMAGTKPSNGVVYTAHCPRNTNSRCEIIPAKRTKTVKGWLRWSIDGELFAVTGNYPDNTIPCTITYEVKDSK